MLALALILACEPGKIEADDSGTSATPADTGGDTGSGVVGDTYLPEPVAVAGPDQSLSTLVGALLDASGSYDPDGLEITAVAWTLISTPDGSRGALDGAETTSPELWLDMGGTYTLSLTVQNSDGVWDSTPDTVEVTATPAEAFYVEMWWDSVADLDLHLMDESAELFGESACAWCQPNPSWGDPSQSEDDPALMLDTMVGPGVEVIAIERPAVSIVNIGVHYFHGDDGSSTAPVSDATVNVWVSGTLTETYTGTLDAVAELWSVASADLPSGALTSTDTYSASEVMNCSR